MVNSMSRYDEFVRAIKTAALEAVDASKPVEVRFGTVVSADPLQIKVDQKVTLSGKQIVLSAAFAKRTEPVTGLEAIGITSIEIDNSPKEGEIVIMLRFQGGQRYLIIDRVVN